MVDLDVGPPGAGRIPSLDGWRGLAILLVLGSHFAFTSGLPPLWGRRSAWEFDGELGVRIFFVLSGFLISLLLLRESARTGGISLRHFYLRRAFRIFPVYFAYLGVLAAMTVARSYSDSSSSWLGCLTFTRNMVGRGRSGTAHFWSLAVEEQFYLGWPILFAGLRLWRRPELYLALLFGPILFCPAVRYVAHGMEPGGTFVERLLGERSILVYADSLAVGCLGAWWAWRRRAGWIWATWCTRVLLGCVAAIVLGHALAVAGGGAALAAVVPSLQAWAILGCLLLCAHPDSPGHRFLNSRAMVGFGVLSYSLYVWHFLFLSHFMERTAPWVTDDWKLWLLPAAVVSVISYTCLERPLVAVRRRLQD